MDPSSLIDPSSMIDKLLGAIGKRNNTQNVTRKCKPVIYSSEKRKKVLSEYCKIITEQKDFIAQKFKASFDNYSEQVFNDFDKDKFMEFIHENIFDYLDTIFIGSENSQFALLNELKDVIVDCMYDAMMETPGSNDLLKSFKECLSKNINNTIPVIDQTSIQQGGAPFMDPKLIQNIKDKSIKQLKDMSGYTGLKKMFNKELQEQNQQLQQQNKELQQQIQQYQRQNQQYPQQMQQLQQQIQQYQQQIQQYQRQNQQYPQQNQQLQQQMQEYPQQMQQYPQQMQQYQQQMQEYPQQIQHQQQNQQQNQQYQQPVYAEPISNIPSQAISTDHQKVLGDVVDFFPKNSDIQTVNSKILEIIKKTLNDVINKNREELYKPAVDAIQKKIQVLVRDINTSNNNIKMSLLLHMLNDTNSNFTVVQGIVTNLIAFVKEQPSSNDVKELITSKLQELISVVELKEMPIENESKGGKRRGQAKTKNQATTQKNKRKTMRKKRIISSR